VIDNDYLLLASAALLAASAAYMVLDLPSAGNARFRQRRFLIFGLAPILLSGIGFLLYLGVAGRPWGGTQRSGFRPIWHPHHGGGGHHRHAAGSLEAARL
jgi:hypothetical protein